MHLRVAGDAGREGLVPTTHAFGVALSDIVRCAACGHMQLQPMPDREVLESAYADAQSDAYLREESGQRMTADHVLGRIESHRPPGRLLDLGCWLGFLLDEAQQRGWEVLGVEPSQRASAYARARFGLEVQTSSLLEAELEPASFDAIVLGDVIEHLPEPAAALRRLRSLAAPGAILALMLPDSGSRVARILGSRWWSVIPTHVQYFTRSSLVSLLASHGWQTIALATSPKVFSVGYYLGRIGGYSPRLGALAEASAARAGVAERMWAPDFRDRMLVLAQPVPMPAGRCGSTGPATRS